MVPMRDGPFLCTDVYKSTGERHYPVLLMRSPHEMNFTLDPAFGLLPNHVRRGSVGVVHMCATNTSMLVQLSGR